RDLDARVQEHQSGVSPEAYTYKRRPVVLVWYAVVEQYSEAYRWEHQIKGWGRAKKEALIRGDIEGIHEIVRSERRRRENHSH
ncbi:MAG TPA: GIY-YIG nuclease family protein, partial [Geobacteraceae bacterium]